MLALRPGGAESARRLTGGLRPITAAGTVVTLVVVDTLCVVDTLVAHVWGSVEGKRAEMGVCGTGESGVPGEGLRGASGEVGERVRARAWVGLVGVFRWAPRSGYAGLRPGPVTSCGRLAQRTCDERGRPSLAGCTVTRRVAGGVPTEGVTERGLESREEKDVRVVSRGE